MRELSAAQKDKIKSVFERSRESNIEGFNENLSDLKNKKVFVSISDYEIYKSFASIKQRQKLHAVFLEKLSQNEGFYLDRGVDDYIKLIRTEGLPLDPENPLDDHVKEDIEGIFNGFIKNDLKKSKDFDAVSSFYKYILEFGNENQKDNVLLKLIELLIKNNDPSLVKEFSDEIKNKFNICDDRGVLHNAENQIKLDETIKNAIKRAINSGNSINIAVVKQIALRFSSNDLKKSFLNLYSLEMLLCSYTYLDSSSKNSIDDDAKHDQKDPESIFSLPLPLPLPALPALPDYRVEALPLPLILLAFDLAVAPVENPASEHRCYLLFLRKGYQAYRRPFYLLLLRKAY